MKKYIFMRILRSLVSIFMVTTLTYTIIYTMVPRKLIFKQDPNYNKIATTPDKKTNYLDCLHIFSFLNKSSQHPMLFVANLLFLQSQT